MSPQVAQRREVIEQLCRDFHVRRLELFGSAAAGHDLPGESDLDFLVEFEQLPPGAYSDSYFGLLEALGRLFNRPIDLVVASAIKNPYFRKAVEGSKTPLYARAPLPS
ncbi:MAG: nucleotidyltransferase domain-containing protein [Thermoanaerobaculia bacterium]